MKRTVLLSLFAAGLMLALSACGGGTSNKNAQAPTTNAETTTPTTSTKTKQARTTPASTTPTQTTATATSTVKAPSLPASECARLTVLAAKMGQAFNGSTPAADTRAYADYLQQLAKTAPTEIRGDFAVLADAYTKIADAVAAVYTKPGATPSADQLKKLTDVGRELNQGAIKRAADNINSWLQTGCSR